jgi:ribonuclease HII
VARRTGRKLLQYDRKLGARFVAGADEAGRGPLAGPLLVAGVLLDYARLHDHAVRPLACLNDSKQCSEAEREALFRAVMGCAERVVVRAVPPSQIDRDAVNIIKTFPEIETLPNGSGCFPAARNLSTLRQAVKKMS